LTFLDGEVGCGCECQARHRSRIGWRSGVKDALVLVWDGSRAVGWGLRRMCAELPELDDPDEGGGEGADPAGLALAMTLALGRVTVSWLLGGMDAAGGGFEYVKNWWTGTRRFDDADADAELDLDFEGSRVASRGGERGVRSLEDEVRWDSGGEV
jgi:hypothetical protein